MYIKSPYKLIYDANKYNFKKIISDVLEVDEKDLINLHKIKKYEILTREKDQKTIWHKMYYDNFTKMFFETYLILILDIKNIFEYQEIIYQKIPTFRVQLGNGNLAVGEWHKDKTYNHGITEVNFWLPFVDTNESNTIWMESKEDVKDYRPYTVKYGEILVFDGANLNHGNKNNFSDETRISIDFRLIDPNKFKPNEATSINMKTKFDIGGYFEKI